MKYYKVYNYYTKRYDTMNEKDFNKIKHSASLYFEIDNPKESK